MNKTFLHILLLFCSCALFAQNLVPNGSFEEYDTCPELMGGDFRYLKEWFSPTSSTPDYFRTCSQVETGIPFNITGYQNAKTGEAYTGIVLNSDIGYREYIGTKLTKTLTSNSIYLFEFYVSLSEVQNCSCNNFGILFMSDTSNLNKIHTLYGTQLIHQEAYANPNVISDTTNWVKIFGTYSAFGNEKFILIGNFRNQNETEITCTEGIPSYYYIDDVMVIELQYDFPNVFTPNNDGLNDYIDFEQLKELEGIELTIYNRWGFSVFSYRGIGSSIWDGENNSDGIYFYILKIKDYKKTGFIHLMR